MKHPIVITSRGVVTSREKYTKDYIISKYLSTHFGRSTLAQSMVQPLRTRLDYQGIARKAFAIQQLPQGALPVYDRDPNVTGLLGLKYKFDAIKISSRGEVYKKGNRPGKITFPAFQTFSSPSIKLSDVKARRFNIIDRNIQKAKNQIMSQEDSMIFEALDQLSFIK